MAAASDLAVAWKELGTAYEQQTGQKVVFSFGSTGLLAAQLSQGAPFDVFAAANVSFVDEVVKAGACDGLRAFADEVQVPIVHVTHHRNEARALGDRVVMFERGPISAVGALDEHLPAVDDSMSVDSVRCKTP